MIQQFPGIGVTNAGNYFIGMNILVIDNYDSFTYNLVHYLEPMAEKVDVVRNDRVDLSGVQVYHRVVFSPGPGLPRESGIMFDILDRYGEKIPILGICLGHQAIIEFYGGSLENLHDPLHGRSIKTTVIKDDELFKGIDRTFACGRYHSWAARPQEIPDSLEIKAMDGQGYVMAVKHRRLPIRGLQFHPESAMTPDGHQMLENWMETR